MCCEESLLVEDCQNIRLSFSLEVGRITVQPLNVDHITNDYLAWLHDPDVSKGLDGVRGRRFTLESIGDFIEAAAASSDMALLGIFLDGKHIGNITLTEISDEHRHATLGIMIGDKKLWGQGIAARCLKVLKEECFQQLHMVRLQAMAYDFNQASLSVFARAGFQVEGRKKCAGIVDGRCHDLIMFGVVNRDVAERR